MNIIEKLGGYEVAKKHLDSSWCDDDNREYLLEKLLEYRKQHNIFEVDDLVVEISESPETSILKVIHMGEYLMVCENDSLTASYGVLNEKPSFYVKHATEEEIKVGHRL